MCSLHQWWITFHTIVYSISRNELNERDKPQKDAMSSCIGDFASCDHCDNAGVRVE